MWRNAGSGGDAGQAGPPPPVGRDPEIVGTSRRDRSPLSIVLRDERHGGAVFAGARRPGSVSEPAGEGVSWADDFLVDRDPDGWSRPEGFPAAFTPHAVFFQRHGGRVVPNGLEVVLASAGRKPQQAQMRDGYVKRRAGRASPVLLIVGYPSTAPKPPVPATGRPHPGGTRLAVCGPVGDSPAVLSGVDVAQVERVADCALGEPDSHAAVRMLQKVLVGLDAPDHARLEVGLRNVGLLASQELRAGLPQRDDWTEAVRAGRPLLALRGRRLAEGLGFRVEQHANHVHLLMVNGHSRAAAVFCHDDEPFDAPARRFDGITPVSLALAHADAHGAATPGPLNNVKGGRRRMRVGRLRRLPLRPRRRRHRGGLRHLRPSGAVG